MSPRSCSIWKPAGPRWCPSQTLQAAPIVDRLDAEVTVTDPRHSLYGQRLRVVSTGSPRGRNWITVLLADGRRRHVRREATDLVSASGFGCQLPQISVQTLLPLAYLIQALLKTSQEEVPDGLPLPVDQPPSQDANTADAMPLDAATTMAGPPGREAASTRSGIGPVAPSDEHTGIR